MALYAACIISEYVQTAMVKPWIGATLKKLDGDAIIWRGMEL